MRSFFAAAALLGAVSASPYTDPETVGDYIRSAGDTPVGKASTATEEPCAQISSILANSADPTTEQLDVYLAQKCLTSVPLAADNAPTQLLGLDTFTDFQSTLAWLKDPTPGYMMPAVDIKGGLQKISDSLKAGKYTNEYDFQYALAKLVSSTYDFHFNYGPDITGIFYFYRSNDLLSLSKDGQSLPEIYMDLDLPALASSNGSSPFSPVDKINGQPVETFLNNVAADLGAYQDPDANYNSLFPVIPLQATNQGGIGLFKSMSYFEGTDTTVTFKNGSTKHITQYATTSANFKGVTDGKSFFQKFCQGNIPTVSSAAASYSVLPSSLNSVGPSSVVSYSGSLLPSSSAVPSAAIQVPSSYVPYSAVPSQTAYPGPLFYPKPWTIAHDLSNGCYFPAEEKDLAVLSVPTFGPANVIEFSDITRECLATAAKLGKKKLMIDLRGNGGGTVLLAYDMFKQLFPSIQPWGATNFRAFDLFNDLGKIVTAEYADTTAENATQKDYFKTNFATIFNSAEELDKMDLDFDNWADFYGPVHLHGDTFTNLVRYNLSDPYQTGNISISDYGKLTGIVKKQTFTSDNIVLLHDGACGSTCAVFAEFMKSQGKVKSVAIGGRKQYGPMQGVSGSKGANVYTADYLAQMIQDAFNAVPESERKDLINKYNDGVEAMVYASERCYVNSEGDHQARVNIRNNIRQGDSTTTPLQFVYEAADCRLFYTPQMIPQQSLVWKAAYDANWGSGSCVKGSTGDDSSKPGTGYILSPHPGSSASASASSGASSASSTSNAPPSESSKPNAGGKISLGFGGLTVMMAAFGFAFMLL